MPTVAIAGATGVLGHALAPRLLARGWRVRALTLGRRPVPEGTERVDGDLLDPSSVSRLVEGCDAAIHAATAIPADPANAAMWALTSRLRIEGTRILLAACAAARVRRYVQQSIVMAYADGGERWLDESTPFDPANRAAPAVLSMEEQVRASSLEWTIFRGGLFVGPGTFQDARLDELRRGVARVPGEGRAWMPYVHVDDVADGAVALLERGAPGSIFHLVDAPIRQGEYFDRLARAIGAPTPPRDPSAPPPPSLRCTNDAARDALGWEPSAGIVPAS